MSAIMDALSVKTAPETVAYRLEWVEVAEMSPSQCGDWVELLERQQSGSPMHDPRSLRDPAVHGNRRSTAYLLYRGDRLCGVASFQLRDWPLKWQIGELSVAQFSFRRLCLLGGGTTLPDDPAAYVALFQEIREREAAFDAVYLEDVPTDSFLWKFVSEHPAAQSFSRYAGTEPKPRVILRLEGTFDEYMDKFSAKHRKNLKRTLRLFEEQAPGEVRSERITAPEDVESFVNEAVAISRKTYQWNLLGLGLRSPELLKDRLLFMARQGWLRAYLLTVKNTACAFVIGFQYGGRYYLDDMAYDPAWKDYSAGKVLQLYILRDLFEYHIPQIYDMGEYGPHKEEFGNDNYLQGSLFLLDRRLYPRLICAGRRACDGATARVSAFAERFGWKKRLKKLLRAWSSKT
jgi:hypothetical protein